MRVESSDRKENYGARWCPNRIGPKAIEFDYCCVHAALLPAAIDGYETING